MNREKNISSNPSAKGKIYLISAAHFVHDTYTSFLSPALPLLIENLSLSYTSASFLRVILRIPSLLNPLIGVLADNMGVKYFIALSPAITAVTMCLIGNAPNYLSILILLFVAGISSSFFHVPAPVILKRISKKGLGLSMSYFQIGGELSRAVGPLVIVATISLWGFSGIYRLIPFGALVSLILILNLKNETFPQAKSKKLYIRQTIFETILHGKILFVFLMGLMLIKSFTASILVTFLPTYLTEKGYSLWIAGGALALLQAAAVIGVFLTGTISDKIGRRPLLIFLTAGAPIAMLLFVLSNKWTIIPALILLGIIALSSTPVILALIQERDFKYPSVANGLYMTISFMMASVIVLIFGKISDMVGLEKAFYLAIICSFIGLPVLFLNPEKTGGDKTSL
ncbi:MAG: MFS transporter [Elusimicrobiales bacterium]|nr:MFS transporter [Elusimicrobiales bacterium]